MEPSIDPQVRFAADTAGHQMTVLLDQGIYRHLRFRNPGSSEFWFELLTSPGLLTINGDMGTFTFSRLKDMLQFFRRTDGAIRGDYWHQKLVASDEPAKPYSAKVFIERILEDAGTQLDDAGVNGEQRAAALAELQEDVLDLAEGEHEAVTALREFTHDLLDFTDHQEHDFTEYSFHFLWNLHAIVDGISRYDTHAAAQVSAAA